MEENEYLRQILAREAVDTSAYSPVRNVQSQLMGIIREWAGTTLRSVAPSGSFAKGSAIHSGTDIDLFISLHEYTTTSLEDIYYSLNTALKKAGYSPKLQNVSLNIRVSGYSVDLVPARRQQGYGEDHSLYRRKADSWTKTNVDTHISLVANCGRREEVRLIKLWRNQKSFDFPSFYLELAVIEALSGRSRYSALADNMRAVFDYLKGSFPNARFVDPANSNNIISEDLTAKEKQIVASWARSARDARYWGDIVK